MSLNFYNPIKGLQSAYKYIMHPEAKGSYPLLERAVAYVLPTAAAGVALYSDRSNATSHMGQGSENIYKIPAAIAGYIASQFTCTYMKSHIENMDQGKLKSLADFTVTQLDIVNDFLVLIPAYNILPTKYHFNKVFAFDVMPEIIKGVESDLKNWWNKKDYENEVAGRIYAGAIAGGVSRNAASYLTDRLGCEGKFDDKTLTALADVKYQKVEDKIKLLNNTSNENFAINSQREFIDTFARTSISAMAKKLLIGKGYQKGDIIKDFSESIAQNILINTTEVKSLEKKLNLEGTIFAGGASISGAICGVNLVQYCLNTLETLKIFEFLKIFEDHKISELDGDDLISPTQIISEL